ncbi:hypothetical protein EXE59_18615 [Nocardioides eburneiflavus]|uniref:histidine kinase n=1 Tax=Nocardioides eburneiflavus TaxID=2518372 RepID=A0A4Z1BWN6_9ACTN|nr:hypothetical protein [Nocardioides eburneiflavus]TGN65741.1 hypothetical protein EXE59_18615 [Nocardioides eburneiflavus]
MLILLDAAAGLALLAVGLMGWTRARTSAAFATAAGMAWFAASAWPETALLHRPLLLHAVVALAGTWGRPVVPRALIVAAWVGIALPAAVQSWVSVILAALCLASAFELRASTRQLWRATASRQALVVLAAGLALPWLERLVWPRYADAGLPLGTYLAAVILCAGALLRGIAAPGLHDTDAVVELSGRTPAEAAVELARLAQDESDPRLREAIRQAVALLDDNARLQLELAQRIDDVRASRLRLSDAAVQERRRLEGVLAHGAMRYLDELEECLGSAGDSEPVRACLDEITRTREDLEQLGRGLHPRSLTEHGLAAALSDLSRRSTLPIEVTAPVGRWPERIECAVWYALAESLANVSKHAQATRASVTVECSDDELRAIVTDDGVGGAVLIGGGGLAGLVDRLAVVDGTVDVVSTPAGTTVTLAVPL